MTETTEIRLTILILVYSDVPDGIDLYNRLKPLLDGEGIRLMVIDNDCTEKELLRKHVPESEILVNRKNLGYAGGNNAGVKQCIVDNSEYFMILNPDIEISLETIKSLITQMDASPQCAFIGPRICYRNDRTLIYSDGGIVEPNRGYRVSHRNSKRRTEEVKETGLLDASYMNGSALIGRVKAIQEIGTMRDEFFIYFEETEWCLRAKDYDWNVLVDTSQTAYHLSSPKGAKYQFLMRRNKLWLAKMRGRYVLKTIMLSLWQLFMTYVTDKPHKKAHRLGIWHGIKYSAENYNLSNRTIFKL